MKQSVSKKVLASILVLAVGRAAGVLAQQTAGEPRKTLAALNQHPSVAGALRFLESDDAATLADQRAMTAIPAPPFKEQVRAEDYRRRLIELGLKSVRIDREGNVIGLRPGSGRGPRLVVSAHLDTVFPEGTDVGVKEKSGRLYAPGIGDDTRGLAAMLSVIRALQASPLRTVGDIVFVATVGEEGLGDLRGVKALFHDDTTIDGFISIDGVGFERLTVAATGSKRYRVSFSGPGGHSFGAFGLPSAIHAMGRAIARIADLQTPKDPKTTFTVGTVKGGTSVNSIAGSAMMEVDMRSNDTVALAKLEAQVLAIIKDAVAEENRRWNAESLTAEIMLVGDRPAGAQDAESPVAVAAIRTLELLGVPHVVTDASSTDANLPISLGVPSVTMRGGGSGGNGHSVDEWYQPIRGYLGPQAILLAALSLVGVDGLTAPLLPVRTQR